MVTSRATEEEGAVTVNNIFHPRSSIYDYVKLSQSRSHHPEGQRVASEEEPRQQCQEWIGTITLKSD